MALCSLSRRDSQKWTIISQNPTWYCKKYISSMSSVHVRKKLRGIRTPALKSYNFLNPGSMTPKTWKAKSQTCLRLRKDTLSQLLSRAREQTLRIVCHRHQLDDTRAHSRRQEKCKRAAVLPESSCRVTLSHITQLPKPGSLQAHSSSVFLDQNLSSREARVLPTLFLCVLSVLQQSLLFCDTELTSLQGCRGVWGLWGMQMLFFS